MTSGPTLLFEAVPSSATAAVGAWVSCGSAHEAEREAGITHLLEHLLLRRCGRRSPTAIAELIDALGGSVDAFTTREVCAVTAHVPVERLADAADLVLDAVLRPHIRKGELELERRVVGAEFDLVQDSPAEVAAEDALAACWGSHPLARPVLGSREAVGRLGVKELEAFHTEHFHGGNLLAVLAGPPGCEGVLARRLDGVPVGPASAPLTAPTWQRGCLVSERAGLEQVYANLVLPGLPADDPEIYTLGVLHQLLGAGASSRLFRELRDRLGLVYEVSTSIYATVAAGVLEVTFSTPVRRAGECWDALLEVLDEVGAGRITPREVALGRQALDAGVVLGSEGTDALMEAHAGEWLARQRRFEPAQVRRELQAIDVDRVRALATRLVRVADLAGAVCGPSGGIELPDGLAQLHR